MIPAGGRKPIGEEKFATNKKWIVLGEEKGKTSALGPSGVRRQRAEEFSVRPQEGRGGKEDGKKKQSGKKKKRAPKSYPKDR